MGFITFKKTTDYVEVYLFSGENYQEIIDLLTKLAITHKFVNTKVGLGKDEYYYRYFNIQQDGNNYVLHKGMYLVRDNLNTINTYTELRLKKLYDRVDYHGIF